MKHIKLYLLNLFKAFSTFLKAFGYALVPSPFIDRADGAYADISSAEMISAMAYAGRKMLEEGLTLDSYIWRQNDCDDFAFAKCHHARAYLRDHYGSRIGTKGIPVGMFGYVRKDGRPHQIVKALIHGEPIYFEAYGESQYAAVKELTRAEEGSCSFDVM